MSLYQVLDKCCKCHVSILSISCNITIVMCYPVFQHACDELGMELVGNTHIHFVVIYLHKCDRTVASFWLCQCVDGPSVPHNLRV